MLTVFISTLRAGRVVDEFFFLYMITERTTMDKAAKGMTIAMATIPPVPTPELFLLFSTAEGGSRDGVTEAEGVIGGVMDGLLVVEDEGVAEGD